MILVSRTVLGTALLINLLLVLIIAEGAAVLQTAAVSTGGIMPCVAWYNNPVVNAYFAAGGGWRGTVLYALSALFPGWLLGIAAVAVVLSLTWRERRRWLPLATLVPLMAALAILWPIVQILGCALE